MTSPKKPVPMRIFEGIVDFVVGDDWLLAVGVIVVLCITALVGRAVASWWVLVVGVPIVLFVSLARATRSHSS
jgi:hypothetical protein